MMDELRKRFDAYVVLASGRIERLRMPRREGTLSLIRNLAVEIAATVEELEESSEFSELVRATQETFRGDFHSAKPEGRWKWPVQTFFKRSGFYTKIGGVSFDQEGLFDRYGEAFGRREINVRYLAPLELVEFKEQRIECGSFEIRRFSKAELDEVFGTEVNRVFYGYAFADTSRLSDYWFLVVDGVERAHAISTRLTTDLSGLGSVFSSYSLPPLPVERAVRVLSLFDWQLATPKFDDRPGGWTRVGFPLTIRTSDDSLEQPRAMPDLSVLETETRCDQQGEEYEVPAVYAEVEEEACHRLGDFCLRVGQFLREFGPDHSWHFFEVGMTYIVRAFLTWGLDQLLWHVTALEALLGEGVNEPIRSTVGKRLGTILGETRSAQKTIKSRFNDLYDLRCDLVHGNRVVSSVAASDLAELRTLARRTGLWFAHWLRAIESEAQADTSVLLPRRRELLTMLDLGEDQRVQIARLLRRLPTSFPRIREWLE